MRKVVVFEEPLSRRYRAPRLSFAYLCIILSNIILLAVPLYFYVGTDGDLWKKHGSYREQPDVRFLYKFVMVLEATSPTTGQSKEIFVSTMDSLNAFRPESFRMASVEFHEDDPNLDGKFDSFSLEADVPLGGDEQILSVQAALFFRFRLRKRVKFDMESVAYTSAESSLPMSGFSNKGDLVLRQTHPLGIRAYSSELYADDTPLVDIDSTSANRASDSNIGHILDKYRERDVAVDYMERYPIKSRALGTRESHTFHIEMKIDVPEQEILYIPTLVEVLKDAWAKYLSVVVLCWIMIKRIKSFAFKQHL